jgi:hypothetical protein
MGIEERRIREYRVWSIEYRMRQETGRGRIRGSAKVQIGAELLCKRAKVKPTSGDG